MSNIKISYKTKKYLSCLEIAKMLSQFERNKFLIGGTSVRPNDILQKVVVMLIPKVKRIVEIGTGFGISAVALACCSNVEKVITFDIKHSIYPKYLSRKFNVEHKIDFFAMSNSKEIYKKIETFDFDLAYIDGGHIPPFVLNDFNAMKHIGRVLFDDANSIHVRKVIDDNGGKMLSKRFGYWCNDKNYDIVSKIKHTLDWDETLDINGKLDCDYSYLGGL